MRTRIYYVHTTRLIIEAVYVRACPPLCTPPSNCRRTKQSLEIKSPRGEISRNTVCGANDLSIAVGLLAYIYIVVRVHETLSSVPFYLGGGGGGGGGGAAESRSMHG